MPQQFALAKAAMPVLREGGVVGNAVGQIETSKPPIRQVQMYLFAQPSFRSDAEAVADKQHTDQQLRVDQRAASVAVEVCEMRSDAGQINEPINRPQQVVLGHMVLQRELVEQCRLRFLPRSHHRKSLPMERIESATYASIKDKFFNKIRPTCWSYEG
jgi:hypothetical protein